VNSYINCLRGHEKGVSDKPVRRNLEEISKRAIFVLGAGASRDAGLPLYQDLLSRTYLEELKERLQNMRLGLGYTSSRLDFIDGYFYPECEHFAAQGKDFESLLTRLDKPKTSEEHERLLRFYQHLIAFAEDIAGFKEEHIYYLRLFAGWLLHLQLDSPYRVSVLSFNHDLLLERILGFTNKIFNYGLSTQYLYNGIPGSMYENRNKKEGGLNFYKLHGSTSWTICQNSHIMYYPEEAFLMGFPLEKTCPKCHTKTRLCIVPPQRIKNYRPLQVLWDAAAQDLQEAAVVTFIGYSESV